MSRWGRTLRRQHTEQGAAAVEFALVALPLFLVLFGIIQYGLLFYQVQGAASAAKDAARWAAAGILDCTRWESRTLERAATNGVGAGLDPVVTAGFDTPQVGDPTVRVTLTFTPRRLVPLVPVPDVVARTATADVENLPAGGVSTGCP